MNQPERKERQPLVSEKGLFGSNQGKGGCTILIIIGSMLVVGLIGITLFYILG